MEEIEDISIKEKSSRNWEAGLDGMDISLLSRLDVLSKFLK
jgi:hypothetical protein